MLSGPSRRVSLAMASVFLRPRSESQSLDDNLNLSLHLHVAGTGTVDLEGGRAESEDFSFGSVAK